ncbi:MAG: hypothetical protein ABJH45_14900 [Paracoccaceae bacterium]|uniref:hypothetical protein n=1 Tax=Shimia thalassica TaxID=1715693 RepID=UPI00329A134D
MPRVLMLRNLLIAGLVGQLAFEAYAWLISPLIFGPSLEPANLVIGLTRTITGATLSYWTAFAIHFVIGSVGFAVFVYLVHLLTKTGLIVSGIIAGVALWFIAQGILAPAMGRDFMMGFGTYTQSSAVAHIGMAALMGAVMARLGTQSSRV